MGLVDKLDSWAEKNPPDPTRHIMRRAHGDGPSGKTCGACVHLQRHTPNVRTYFKCDLNSVSRCETSDWRVSWPSCGKFAEKKSEDKPII